MTARAAAVLAEAATAFERVPIRDVTKGYVVWWLHARAAALSAAPVADGDGKGTT